MTPPRCTRCERVIRPDETAVYTAVGDRMVAAFHWLCAFAYFTHDLLADVEAPIR
jgi:hypothetical protein